MLDELERNSLGVVLTPAPEPRYPYGHMIRTVESINCFWYREFCGIYARGGKHRRRKFQTAIKRRLTIAALSRIAAGEMPKRPDMTVYDDRLIDFIDREVHNKYHANRRREFVALQDDDGEGMPF